MDIVTLDARREIKGKMRYIMFLKKSEIINDFVIPIKDKETSERLRLVSTEVNIFELNLIWKKIPILFKI